MVAEWHGRAPPVNKNPPSTVFLLTTIGRRGYRRCMTLREYRAKHGLTAQQAAERCGLKQTTWSMIEVGGGCRAATAKLIIDGTSGEVTLEDLVGHEVPSPSEAPKAPPAASGE